MCCCVCLGAFMVCRCVSLSIVVWYVDDLVRCVGVVCMS